MKMIQMLYGICLNWLKVRTQTLPSTLQVKEEGSTRKIISVYNPILGTGQIYMYRIYIYDNKLAVRLSHLEHLKMGGLPTRIHVRLPGNWETGRQGCQTAWPWAGFPSESSGCWETWPSKNVGCYHKKLKTNSFKNLQHALYCHTGKLILLNR